MFDRNILDFENKVSRARRISGRIIVDRGEKVSGFARARERCIDRNSARSSVHVHTEVKCTCATSVLCLPLVCI